MLDSVGWAATAVFTVSYFLRKPSAMLRVQAVAACLWMAYGIAIRSSPIVVANLIVAAAALYSSFLNRPMGQTIIRLPHDQVKIHSSSRSDC